MIPLWFSHALIMLALGIGTITDFKKREVPDFLNFSLMGVGIIIGILNSITTMSIFPLLWAIVGLICGYLLGALMFYTGQWGGGDAKMLMGIGAVLGVNLSYFWMGGVELPLFFTVVLTILFAGTIYGIIYGMYLIGASWSRFKLAFAQRVKEPAIIKLRIGIIIIVVILIILAVTSASPYLQWMLGLMALIIFGGFYMVVVGKLIETVCMIKEMKVSDLTQGEWIAKDVFVKGERICGPKDLGITPEQIKKLKKLKVKSVIIKEGIPFIPGFLLGYIIILFAGNWLATILSVL